MQAYDNTIFSSNVNFLSQIYEQIENLEIVQVISSVVLKVFQLIGEAFYCLYNQLTTLAHVLRATNHPSSENSMVLSTRTNSIAEDVFTTSDMVLYVLRDALPHVMVAVNSSSDVLAYTSVCKKLWHNRWEAIAHHPQTISSIFKQALVQYSAASDDVLLRCVKFGLSLFNVNVLPSNVENVLGLIQKRALLTEFSLTIPAPASLRLIPVNFIKEILERFPKTSALEFDGCARWSIEEFAEILARTPQLLHLKGGFPCRLPADDRAIERITFPKTLRSFNIVEWNGSCLRDQNVRQLLTDCRELEILTLRGWYKQGLDLRSISIPSTLKALQLPTAIDDREFLQFMAAGSQLEFLELSHCRAITVESFVNAPFPATLQCLRLTNTRVNDDGLAHIVTSCPRLQYLFIRGCENITQQSLSQVLFPDTLQILDLESNRIDDLGFRQIIRRCTRLEKLNLRGCEGIHSQTFVEEDFPTTLRDLDLSFTSINFWGMKKLLDRCPHLERLWLVEFQGVFSDRSHFPPSLQTLDLSGARLSGSVLHKMLDRCFHLKYLSLSKCRDITTQGVIEATFPQDLKGLDVSSTYLSDNGLQKVLSCCKRLERLSLSGCLDITPQGFAEAQFPPSLQSLSLAGTSIDRITLQGIVDRLPHLIRLDLSECRNISSIEIIQVMMQNWHLSVDSKEPPFEDPAHEWEQRRPLVVREMDCRMDDL
ncbi:MAG: hypothetical protein JSR46_05675 [Verrucomicrobia bacterium]|nr:hypothetical protein [Verrucomicrobiota bacterium]